MRTSIDLPADFERRHLGPASADVERMLDTLGYDSLAQLVDDAVPASIRLGRELDLPEALPEAALLERLRRIASENRVCRSYIGMGYHDTVVPGVILRNILENPGWYTQYTPYQAEISQGRLEALLNFQTTIIDLTGLPVANASLLDEGTAAAEAMHLAAGEAREGSNLFFVSERCHPQTIDVVRTRAGALGIEVVVGDHETTSLDGVFGALVQYPTTDGEVPDYRDFSGRVHEAGGVVIAAADILSLALLTPPGEWGADIAVGSAQRFGVPMGFGGPHAAYMATREGLKRKIPGRIVGVSVDRNGDPALRLALQTREQHIRREKATSNICTAQVLLAIMAGAYAVYHGPEGIRAIAGRVRDLTGVLAEGLGGMGHRVLTAVFFDTIRVRPSGREAADVLRAAAGAGMNLRDFGDGTIGIALDETTRPEDVDDILAVFNGGEAAELDARTLAETCAPPELPEAVRRTSPYLAHPVFHRHRSETEMLRYLHKLESRDLSLNASMIPLGSCTMKLNASTEMAALTWPEFGRIHPFAPLDQAQGYRRVFRDLEGWLAEITGLSAVSLQPNAGAQGEYTGLMVIRAYHHDHGAAARNVCLIPSSAHGTNPASSVMAGMEVVVVRCDDDGNIDVADLEAKAAKHQDRLAALMVTYPSTHGVFEPGIRDICRIVHENGGLVYLDGANLNAQVGLARPGDYGADVCHINLHKTFAIPHGGGGPGMGPICVGESLAPYLPGHVVHAVGGDRAITAVSSAPWGSASILTISWAYIALLGARGVRRASEVAILSANYMAKRLDPYFPVLYKGRTGLVAHEFIVDLRPVKRTSGITEEDVAKRLMDYGFHAPTVSFPVHGTLMIEPTESEPLAELDRLCDALISIREEIRAIETGLADREDNALKNAPHTAAMVSADEWTHPYSRSSAAYPSPATREMKFWPPVARVDNAYGDRNLVCACPPVEAYAEEEDATAPAR